jgi:N6-adenosine-specific RNA methylase IME4
MDKFLLNQIDLKQKPNVPENWSYQESIRKIKQAIYKWKNITLELATELYIAREKLNNQGARTDLTNFGANAPKFTWFNYCRDIGISKSTARRWLERFFPTSEKIPEVVSLPEGKYQIIYADPPWRYWEGGDRSPSKHYSTLTKEQITNYTDKSGKRISDLSSQNCILFLWTTFPVIEDTLEVIKMWGFKYSTGGFVWVKSKQDGTGFAFGNGSWTHANVEFCLIGIKGSIKRRDATISQIIYEPRREHSRKPDVVRDKIVQLVGDLKRIELFARGKSINGWDFWGLEVE